MITKLKSFMHLHNAAQPVGVAVSGGGDSLALAHGLAEVYGAHNVIGLHVDHGLQQGSTEIAQQVVTQLEEWGVSCYIAKWQGPTAAGNVHQQARYGRYGLLAELAAQHSLNAVCTGHTQDDVLEGFFMRLNRGSGLTGLTGPVEVGTIGELNVYRPLLTVTRADLRRYLTENDINWHEDPANEDPAFYRARTRKLVQAWREQGLDDAAVMASISHLQRADQALTEVAEQLAQYYLRETEEGLLLRTTFLEETPELALRLLQHAMRQLNPQEMLPRLSKQQALLERLATGEMPTSLGGINFNRVEQAFRLQAEKVASTSEAA